MVRLHAALVAAFLLFPPGVRAQAQGAQPPAAAAPAPAGDAPSSGSSPATAPGRTAPASSAGASSGPAATPTPSAGGTVTVPPELDPIVRDLVRREVEKAKEDMRDEMRAEIQGAQSAREFMDSAAAGTRPKLDLLQLSGYLRMRGDLFDNLDLHRAADSAGYFLFPRPLRDVENRGTLTSGNMRFRLEPTVNVSEQVRAIAQLDLLDNIVLGSTPQGLFARSDAVQFPFDARGQVPPENGVNSDRSSLVVKRAWAEVQTPVGLLSFGRMPSSFGLGISSHAGNGLNDDYGDSVDRLQFALTPFRTPIGQLVLVPMYELLATGVTSVDLRGSRGIGQPFDRDTADDAKAIGLKVMRVDTDEETKRKLERNEASVSYGAWYLYKTQSYAFPQWQAGSGGVGTGAGGATSPPSTGQPTEGAGSTNDPVGSPVRREAYAHTLDLWGRYQSKRFRLEAELAGVVGEIGNASNDPGAVTGPVLLRQFGGALQAGWSFANGKVQLGGETGFATGDSNPGFGNRPSRGCVNVVSATGAIRQQCTPAPSGAIDGQQFGPGDRVLDIRNFRFNPAYRVDVVLWREILQGVTDAFYVKPTLRYEILEGLTAQAALVYSQAFFASSTPSAVHKPLGIELDLGLAYHSDDGFVAFVDYGVLQPLDGLGYPPGLSVPGRDLTRGHAIRTGLAVKF